MHVKCILKNAFLKQQCTDLTSQQIHFTNVTHTHTHTISDLSRNVFALVFQTTLLAGGCRLATWCGAGVSDSGENSVIWQFI